MTSIGPTRKEGQIGPARTMPVKAAEQAPGPVAQPAGARPVPARLDPRLLFHLQRTAGNRAVAEALARRPEPTKVPETPRRGHARRSDHRPCPTMVVARMPRPGYTAWHGATASGPMGPAMPRPVVQRKGPTKTRFGVMRFAPKDLVADGASTTTASVSTVPTGVALTWSLEGAAHGSTIDAGTGVITAGGALPVDTDSVTLAVKATDKADASRSKTGNIKLWNADFKKALDDFPKFLGSSYALPNYTIGTNGKFDAKYVPSSKRLDVTVKIKFQFQGVWSRKAKDRYRASYMSQVRSAWNNRYQFTNIRSPKSVWKKLGPVRVNLSVPEVNAGQHFLIQVAKTPGTAQVAGGVTNLFQGDITPQFQFNPGTKQGEIDRLNRANPSPLAFAKDSATIDPTDEPKLEFLATYLKRISNPPISLAVVGHANDSASKRRNLALSAQRAQAVRNKLVGAGLLNHPVSVAARGQTGSVAGDASWQKATITPRIPGGWKNIQAVVPHEFGHMIGLGDEYGATGTKSTHYNLVVNAFGQLYADQVAKRGEFDSSSIMEGGNDVRIQHYVTFWSALCDATATAAVPVPQFGQADWKFIG